MRSMIAPVAIAPGRTWKSARARVAALYLTGEVISVRSQHP
jgi:hypothetical protein